MVCLLVCAMQAARRPLRSWKEVRDYIDARRDVLRDVNLRPDELMGSKGFS